MAHLMRNRLSHIVILSVAAWNSVRTNGASILEDGVGELLAGDGQRAEAKVAQRGDEPQVEVVVAAVAQVCPHALEVGVVGPGGVDGFVDALQVEDDAGRCIIGLEHLELIVESVVLIFVVRMNETL